MASTVDLNHITFTPDVDGQLILTGTLEAQRTVGSDWGSGATTTPYCTQNGTTVNGDSIALSTTRTAQVVRHVFTVVAGASVTVGLRADISGASAATWWNIKLTAELIKR